MYITEKSLSLAYSLFMQTPNGQPSNKAQFHYTFLFERNKLIACGQNSYEIRAKAKEFADRFNVGQKKQFPYLHSEISAIARLWGRKYINHRIKLVNVRFTRAGQLIGRAFDDRPENDLVPVGLEDVGQKLFKKGLVQGQRPGLQRTLAALELGDDGIIGGIGPDRRIHGFPPRITHD